MTENQTEDGVQLLTKTLEELGQLAESCGLTEEARRTRMLITLIRSVTADALEREYQRSAASADDAA